MAPESNAPRIIIPFSAPMMGEMERVKFCKWFDRVAEEKASLVRESSMRNGKPQIPGVPGFESEKVTQTFEQTGATEGLPQGLRPNRARKGLIEEVTAGRRRPSCTNKQMQGSYKQHSREKTVDRGQVDDFQQAGRSIQRPRQDVAFRKAMDKNNGNDPTATPTITLTPPPCASSNGHATGSTTIFKKANPKRSSNERKRLFLSEELGKSDASAPYTPTRIANGKKKIAEGRRRLQVSQSQFSLGALDQVENVEKAAAQNTGDTPRSYERTVRLGLLCSNEAESTRVAAKFAADGAAATAYL